MSQAGLLFLAGFWGWGGGGSLGGQQEVNISVDGLFDSTVDIPVSIPFASWDLQ